MDHTHVANPVRVKARQIVSTSSGPGDSLNLHLDDGHRYIPTPEMMSRYTPCSGDYLVTQDDGYEYLNPREVFERKYSMANDAFGLNFGDAIARMKLGMKVARAGWNGKGMWLSLSCNALYGPREIAFENFWSNNNSEYARQNGGSAVVLPCITMKTATGEILMGWLASQSDMLAEDWQIVL